MRGWRYHREAERELIETAQWYEERRAGLGGEFIEAVTTALELVREDRLPGFKARESKRDHVRKVLMGRFPYLLVLDVREEHRAVLAVAHDRRRPGYWKARRA